MTGLRFMSENDLPQVMAIISQAQAFMAMLGINQWQNGYPNPTVMQRDIEQSQGYVYEVDGQVAGILTIVWDGEPTYEAIYEGSWHTTEPYACIHRIAVGDSFRGTGIVDAMMNAAESVIAEKGIHHIRIDTHRHNNRMQHMLERHGFLRCGLIYLSGGTDGDNERVAFDKSL